MRTYDLYTGEELLIAEKIQQRRLQLLVHSCIYYELDMNTVSDRQWDEWAKELLKLQRQYPDIAENAIWAEAFKDWDASTGAFLPIKDKWVMNKALIICGKTIKKGVTKEVRKEKSANVKKALF